jgi:hypothetical protein
MTVLLRGDFDATQLRGFAKRRSAFRHLVLSRARFSRSDAIVHRNQTP